MSKKAVICHCFSSQCKLFYGISNFFWGAREPLNQVIVWQHVLLCLNVTGLMWRQARHDQVYESHIRRLIRRVQWRACLHGGGGGGEKPALRRANWFAVQQAITKKDYVFIIIANRI